MKKSIVFLVLALVSTSAFLSVRPIFAADVTLPFQDGFESGDFSKWSVLAGGSVTSGDAHHGTYKAVFSSGYIQAQFTPIDQCFMRAYVMFKAFPASGFDCTVFGIWRNSPSRYMAEVRVVNVGGTVKWRLRYWDSTAYYYANSEQQKPVLDTWYCVEVKGKSNTATDAESRIYINGNELTDITQTGKNNDAQINQVYIWISSSSTIWYDCVVVDTAYIGPETYTLTTSVVGGGSVSKNPDQATYDWGTNVELTAHANLGWTFAGWSGGASGTSNPVTVTITDNTAVTATFTQNTYTLTTSVVGSGSVTRDNYGPYYYGDVVQLTAIPTVGWSFHSWSGDLSGSTNPTTITIDGNKAVTATFTTVPVGGEWVPINKTELLAPWISLASLITVAAVSIAYVKRRKKQQN